MPQLITLTSDFGTRDGYVAAMKGAIASIAPEVGLVDVTHDVEAQDVMSAGWVLLQSVPFFPPGTIHVVVIDPGVGTERRGIACRVGEHVFVGPDNGLFSLLLGEDGLGPAAADEVVELDRPEFWRTKTPSDTFHGRDIFAPVAAHLASGQRLDEVGTPASPDTLVRLHWVRPLADDEGVQGWVMHVDRFGNAITNIPASLVERYRRGRPLRCYAGTTILDQLSRTYADADMGEPLVLVGSSGNLEISVSGGDAAGLLSLTRGSAVSVVFGDRR